MRLLGNVLRLGPAIVEAAHAAPDPAEWQRAALAALAPIGFDVAFFETKPPRGGLVSSGFDPAVLDAARARWPEYTRELLPVSLAAARDGIAVDAEVLGAQRERLAYFQEVVRPQRGTSSLFAHLAVGGRELGSLMLGRTGSPFGARETRAVRALLAPLSVGLAAVLQAERLRADPPPVPAEIARHEARAPAEPLSPAVTPREHEVLRLLQLGYTNPEIARGLGTSPNTVRNQVASLFAKVGATTRAELVALTLRA